MTEKLVNTILKDPELGTELLKKLVEKYKPMAYEMCGLVFDVYKDFSKNEEYPAVVAKIQRNKYEAYINAGFTSDQAMALLLSDNIQLMNQIKSISTNSHAYMEDR